MYNKNAKLKRKAGAGKNIPAAIIAIIVTIIRSSFVISIGVLMEEFK